jgi:hypothetical protein
MLFNFVQQILRITLRSGAPAALALVSPLILGGLEASASPVFFQNPPNIGTTASNATDAINSGVALVDLDTPPSRFNGFSFAGAASDGFAGSNCVGGVGPGCIALRITLPGTVIPGSLNDGSIATSSTWTVTNSSDQHFKAAALIFTSSSAALSGDVSLVGLEPDPSDGYVIIQTSGLYAAAIEFKFGPGESWAPGESFSAVVHYVVEDFLESAGGGDFLLPQLQLEAIVVPVPEPGAIALFATGLVGIAALRRRQ